MVPENLFQRYEALVKKADRSFQRMEKDYGDCITCQIHCSDCCHAIFGLFLVEAAFIQRQFDGLGRSERRAALLRANKADRELKKIEVKLQRYKGDPQMTALTLARERVRCPLLDEKEECILYPHRPITCRVYGIPTAVHKKAHVCGKAAFEPGKTYPIFDLDAAYRDLYQLSREILLQRRVQQVEKASLLLSVSKVIKTPFEDILQGDFG
jgi:Fe-S-cluster containining protein